MNLSFSNTLHIRVTSSSRIKLPQPCHYQNCKTLITKYPFVTKRTATHYSKIHSYHIKCAWIISLLTDEQIKMINDLYYSHKPTIKKLNRNGKPI